MTLYRAGRAACLGNAPARRPCTSETRGNEPAPRPEPSHYGKSTPPGPRHRARNTSNHKQTQDSPPPSEMRNRVSPRGCLGRRVLVATPPGPVWPQPALMVRRPRHYGLARPRRASSFCIALPYGRAWLFEPMKSSDKSTRRSFTSSGAVCFINGISAELFLIAGGRAHVFTKRQSKAHHLS